MAAETGISWCDSTFNPWIGCTRISRGCDGCYAARSTPARAMGIVWGAGQDRRRTSVSNWALPTRWNRQHAAFYAAHGRRRRVFCASLADVFDNQVPAAWRADLFQLIQHTPQLDWLLLTKRVGNVNPMMVDVARSLFWMDRLDTGDLPDNVWIGATVVDQAEADRDVPKLLDVRASRRFLSMEPLLGPVSLAPELIAPIQGTSQHGQRFIDWVIVGGESGLEPARCIRVGRAACAINVGARAFRCSSSSGVNGPRVGQSRWAMHWLTTCRVRG